MIDVPIGERFGRKWYASPSTFAVRTLHQRLRSALIGKSKPLRVLLVSDGQEYTSEQQFAPMVRFGETLSSELGFIAQRLDASVAATLTVSALANFDLIGVKLSFRTDSAAAVEFVRSINAKRNVDSTRLIYFDGDDDLNIQWPNILPLVDVYVKKHVYVNQSDYLRSYIGKSNLTDYVAQQFGKSFHETVVPTTRAVAAADLDKIHLGWNIALDDKIYRLSRDPRIRSNRPRDIDVTSRAYVAPSIWTHAMRAMAAEGVEALAPRFRVAAPRERIPENEYLDEMLRSKICVSPFGYGEICWRDFEAILCGCLLVKPDMSHAKTNPNLFIPGVTFAPTKWNYSDLEDVCAYYLTHENERQHIVNRAQSELRSALEPRWFERELRDLLVKLKLVS